jgi:hypothetical protein
LSSLRGSPKTPSANAGKDSEESARESGGASAGEELAIDSGWAAKGLLRQSFLFGISFYLSDIQ